MRRRGRLLLVGAVLVAVLVGCQSAAAAPPSRTKQGIPAPVIFERDYLATSVGDSSSGEPLDPDRLALSFARAVEPTSPHHFALAFTLQCDLFGGEMKIGPHRIWIKMNFQTEQGCPEDALREDEWLEAFLEADPYWEAGPRGRLTLTAPQGTLSLRPGKRKGTPATLLSEAA